MFSECRVAVVVVVDDDDDAGVRYDMLMGLGFAGLEFQAHFRLFSVRRKVWVIR